MKTQVIHVNLNEQLLMINTSVVAAFNTHMKMLFLKEGQEIRDVIKSFPYIKDYNYNLAIVGHFGLNAFDFASYKEVMLTDFKRR